MNEQKQIGNKKKKIIDEDGPISKKVNRNYIKNLNKNIAHDRIKQQVNNKNNQQVIKKQNSVNDQQNNCYDLKKKKIDDIKSILSNHKKQTIKKVLQKHNYDKDLAIHELCDTPQDQNNDRYKSTSAQQSRQKRSKKPKQTKLQIGNEILNQIYENDIQIDPSQFQQLFEQITDIIKQVQKTQGMDLFQINQFVDNCYLIKNIILKDQDQIEIDQNSQLYRLTQQFLFDIIKSRVARQIKRNQDFPTLNNHHQEKNYSKNYIEKIQQGYKQDRLKQQYFSISKVPQMNPIINNQHKDTLFSVNNDPKSNQNILQLLKQYNGIGIDNLKFIYLRLNDINLCKTFLDKYYPDNKKIIKIDKNQDKKYYKDNNYTPKKNTQSVIKYKKILQDQNYKNYSLIDIRNQLDHLFKLRSMFRMTRGKTTNIAYRKQLQRLACRQNPKINKLTQIARLKVIQQMYQQHLQFIDLHGYRAEQIDQLFDGIQDMIYEEFKKGNSKLETTKVGNNVYCVVRAMTGKGLHSKYNKSVLKPAVFQWCQKSKCNGLQTEDSINIYIEVR